MHAFLFASLHKPSSDFTQAARVEHQGFSPPRGIEGGCKAMQVEEYIKGETHSKNLLWNQGIESTGGKHRDTCPENLVEGGT